MLPLSRPQEKQQILHHKAAARYTFMRDTMLLQRGDHIWVLSVPANLFTPFVVCFVLSRSQHNYLRITRILKSLGELGYEAFKAPLVRLFLEESLCHNTIPNMQHSVLEYYVYTIRLPATRRRLLRYARQHYRPAHAFLWGPPPKRRGGGVGGSVGAGSSGIRAPAPTPERQRRGEESTTPAGSGLIVSSHDAMMCQDLAGGGLKGCAGLGSNMAGLEGALMMAGARGERNEYNEIVPL